jgi:CBS-domain-containing membrane protein
MKAADVMSPRVLAVRADATVGAAVCLMLQNRIGGLPMVDAENCRVGIVTEGDFLRRAEAGTERRRPRWLELLLGPGKLADEYARRHGRKVEEVMTREVASVTEPTSIEEIV